MAHVTTRAISLRCIDYSETSQVVMLVTPDMGQVHVLAKGSRRPKKDPRRCPWDALNHYECVFARRATGKLHIATEWTVRDSFPALHEDLRLFGMAFYAGDVVLCCTSETAEDGRAYDALLDFLQRLRPGRPGELALFLFLSRLLKIVGCAPVADCCAHCGGSLHGLTRFSPGSGGALCGDCGAGDSTAFSISRGALAVLRTLGERDRNLPQLKVTDRQSAEIQRAFNEQIQYHLGRSLRSARFMRRCTA